MRFVSPTMCVFIFYSAVGFIFLCNLISLRMRTNVSDNELSHMGISMLVLFSNKKQINRKIMIF